MAVEVAKRITARQGNLRAAFSLLDTRRQEWIDGATMIALFLAIGRYRWVIIANKLSWWWTKGKFNPFRAIAGCTSSYFMHVCCKLIRKSVYLCSTKSKSLLSTIKIANEHIPDVRARTSRLFLALNKRGDFKIWSDEFEELCDVIAKEVERPVDLRMIRRANSRMQIVNHPVYAYVLWAFTLGSLAAAITELNVSYCTLL